ncbi:hypothetical protein Hte_012430 [Hypoxylon texense]
MASIYQNSFLTIAASFATDCRGGCFSESQADHCVRIKNGDSLDAIVVLRDTSDRKLALLFTRAWVYQERMLSRRILYCGEREVQFECQDGGPYECGLSHTKYGEDKNNTWGFRPYRVALKTWHTLNVAGLWQNTLMEDMMGLVSCSVLGTLPPRGLESTFVVLGKRQHA